MSRHHHRFERDYRGPWERRDVRPSGLHNGGANHSCASAVVNGNNRPGLLPLPVIPSLLPTPVTVAVTTSSSDIAVKRGITAAGSVAPASAKVSAPAQREATVPDSLWLMFLNLSVCLCLSLCQLFNLWSVPILIQSPTFSWLFGFFCLTFLHLTSFTFWKGFCPVQLTGRPVFMVQLSQLFITVHCLSLSLCCLLPSLSLTALFLLPYSCQPIFLPSAFVLSAKRQDCTAFASLVMFFFHDVKMFKMVIS